MVQILSLKCLFYMECTLKILGQILYQPYGPHLCELICKRTNTCSNYIFDEVKLKCQLVSSAVKEKAEDVLCGTTIQSMSRKRTTEKPRQALIITKKTVDETLCSRPNVQAFHNACEKGNLMVVKKLICPEKVCVNCRDEHKRTGIMRAAKKNRTKIFDFLVGQMCDLSAVDKDKGNVLHIACISGSEYIVRRLIVDNNFSTEIRGKYGRTPLLYTASSGYIAIARILIGKGANIKSVDDRKDTILHVACRKNNEDMVKYILLLNIIRIDSRGQYGRTPLMNAVVYKRMEIVNLLVKRGAEVKAKDERNDTILHLASAIGHKSMLNYILSLNSIGIDEKGQYGRTPLMNAVRNNHMPIVKLLKGKGVDVNAVDKRNDNILHIACTERYISMVEYILSLNSISINSRGRHGRTPLMNAVMHDNLPMVKLLLKREADIKAVDDSKETILHLACRECKENMVIYILSLKINDKNRKNRYGETPLMIAPDHNCMKVVQLLKGRGAE